MDSSAVLVLLNSFEFIGKSSNIAFTSAYKEKTFTYSWMRKKKEKKKGNFVKYIFKNSIFFE